MVNLLKHISTLILAQNDQKEIASNSTELCSLKRNGIVFVSTRQKWDSPIILFGQLVDMMLLRQCTDDYSLKKLKIKEFQLINKMRFLYGRPANKLLYIRHFKNDKSTLFSTGKTTKRSPVSLLFLKIYIYKELWTCCHWKSAMWFLLSDPIKYTFRKKCYQINNWTAATLKWQWIFIDPFLQTEMEKCKLQMNVISWVRLWLNIVNNCCLLMQNLHSNCVMRQHQS